MGLKNYYQPWSGNLSFETGQIALGFFLPAFLTEVGNRSDMSSSIPSYPILSHCLRLSVNGL